MAEPKTYTLGVTTRTQENGNLVHTFIPRKVFRSDNLLVERQVGEVDDEALLNRIYRIINRLNRGKPNWHDVMWRVRDGEITEVQVA